MDILSEEEVSYYKKSLISQEGSIKKVRQETHQCCKISTVGRNYPLPFTLLIKVERADVDPSVQLHQAVLTPYQHHLSRQRF